MKNIKIIISALLVLSSVICLKGEPLKHKSMPAYPMMDYLNYAAVYESQAENMMFTGFDGIWGNGSTDGDYLTDEGWKINNGSRNIYNPGFGSIACASVRDGGSIISPSKSGGIGSIRFYGSVSSSSTTARIKVYISDNEVDWQEKATNVTFTAQNYQSYELLINDATARYVKVEVIVDPSYSVFYIENFVVTDNGIGIAKIAKQNEPLFVSQEGVSQTINLLLEGANITADVNLRMNSGKAFSLNKVTKILPQDINGKTYTLNIDFKPEAGNYFTDSLIISGEDFAFEQMIPLKGYILQSLIYQDFNSAWKNGSSSSSFVISGWEAYSAVRHTSVPYEGNASLQLSANNVLGGKLLSVPKSGGIGIISFYYRITSAVSPEIQVLTYKNLSDEPIVRKVFTEETKNQWLLFEETINDPEAQYVEIRLSESATTYNINALFDAIIITADGKKVPAVKVPESFTLTTYPNEEITQELRVEVEGVEHPVHLSIQEGSGFSLNKMIINPVNGLADELIEVTYTPDGLSGFRQSTVLLQSEGMLTPMEITVYGNVMEESLVQDFNKTGWLPSEGNAILDGWLLTHARRETIPIYLKEGSAGAALTVSNAKNGSVTSPPKAGGINNVEFYYRNGSALNFMVETSVDGEVWDLVEKVECPSYASSFVKYQKEVANSTAKYLRIQTENSNFSRSVYLYVDSIAVDGMPYLRQVGKGEVPVVTKTPYNLQVEVAGRLAEDAFLTMSAGENSMFTLSKTKLSPEDVAEGKYATIELAFNGAEQSGEYEEAIFISNSENDLYVAIPVSVDYFKTYLQQTGKTDLIETDRTPVSIPIEIRGEIVDKISITLSGDDADFFTLSRTEFLPYEIIDGKSIRFNVTFTADERREYASKVVFKDTEGYEYLSIPLSVKYVHAGENGEVILATCDFETAESFANMKIYDLDGKILSFFFPGEAKGWFWKYEDESTEENSVFAASSVFATNSYDNVIPADDWLFSWTLPVPEDGNYMMAWKARSLHEMFLEDYEVRVIENDLLAELEAGFTSQTPLSEVSATLVKNSDLLLTVIAEQVEWNKRYVNLNKYRGKEIRVIWRYVSKNMHTVYIDDIEYYSQTLSAQFTNIPHFEYTQVPEFTTMDISPSVKSIIENGGDDNLTNVKVKISSYDKNDDIIFTQQFDKGNLMMNVPWEIEINNNFDIMAKDSYYAIDVVSDEGYKTTVKTEIYTGTVLSDSIYAWDNKELSGGVYSNSVGFQTGQKFPIDMDLWLNSIIFKLTENTTSTKVNVHIYEMTNKELKLLTSVKSIKTKPGVTAEYRANLETSLQLKSGITYFVAVEQMYNELLYLGRTDNEQKASIAAYYTTNNAEWTDLDRDYTLYLRLNVSERPVEISNSYHDNVSVYVGAGGYIYIAGAEIGSNVAVYDMKGQCLLNSTTNDTPEQLNIELQKGVYMIKVENRVYKVIK